MHIGFDISQTGAGRAGCGLYAHAMIRAILEIAPENRYSLFPSFGDFYFDPQMPLQSPYAAKNVQYGPRHATSREASDFWLRADVEGNIGRPDIVHANNFWMPVQMKSSRIIYTLYDLGFVTDPSWSTEANRVGCVEGVFRSSISADWVVAISEATRIHYLSTFPHFPEERVRVIYPCSRFEDSTQVGCAPKAARQLGSGGFWLSVGTIEPRKNQRRLVDAYVRYLSLGGLPIPLVLAGGTGWLMDDFQAHLDKSGLAEQVILTGYVSDDELIWLYRNCYANLYPSLFEGFGLPVLEGMQFGAATIAARSTSIVEVAGGAAILVSPTDTDGWTQAMLRLAANNQERRELARRAIGQAARFESSRSGESLLELYSDAMALPKRSNAALHSA